MGDVRFGECNTAQKTPVITEVKDAEQCGLGRPGWAALLMAARLAIAQAVSSCRSRLSLVGTRPAGET